MTIHRLPLCWFNNHTPVRRGVKWDGLNYVGTCACCGETIRRLHKGEWKKDWQPSGLFRAA